MASEDLDFNNERLREALHPTRWKILHTLTKGPSSLKEIGEHVSASPQLVNYHIRLLREHGFVEKLHESSNPKYRLSPQRWSLEVYENEIKTGFGTGPLPSDSRLPSEDEITTVEDLREMHYRELQYHASQFNDIDGRRSRGYLIERLSEKLDQL